MANGFDHIYTLATSGIRRYCYFWDNKKQQIPLKESRPQFN